MKYSKNFEKKSGKIQVYKTRDKLAKHNKSENGMDMKIRNRSQIGIYEEKKKTKEIRISNVESLKKCWNISMRIRPWEKQKKKYTWRNKVREEMELNDKEEKRKD